MKHTILSSETVYKGRAFNVAKVKMQLPDKRLTDYDLVQHADAVTILPLDGDGKVWFVEQYRLGARRKLLELPAGVMDQGESSASAAHRELREEIGMKAETMSFLGSFYMAAGYSSEHMHVFLATGLSESLLPPDEDEFIKVVRYPLVKCYEMAREGKIHDSKTLVTLFLAQQVLLP